MAQGLTSQAIADRLYVSRRTVETHVSRAFRKTGVSTRSALATLMARRRAGSRFGDSRAEQDLSSLVQVPSAVTGAPLRTGHRGLGREAAYLTSTKSPGAVAAPVVAVPAKTKR